MQAAASLKICTLMGSFSQYNIKFQLKGTEELPLMMLEWSKLEEKLTFCLKNDMRNLVNLNTGSGKSENLHSLWWATFVKKYVMFELKNTEELCCEKWLMVSKMTYAIWWIFTQVVESNAR